MEKVRFSSAQKLAFAALALWCFSLLLTSFILSGHERVSGLGVLITGWLSPLVYNYAWFANVFFVYGFFRILEGKAPVVAAFAAVILSLDTVRFDTYILNEGGASSQIYGYGWGAVLWFLALSVFLIAVGVRCSELRSGNEQRRSLGIVEPLGFIFLILILVVSIDHAIKDWHVAHAVRPEPQGFAFKREGFLLVPKRYY